MFFHILKRLMKVGTFPTPATLILIVPGKESVYNQRHNANQHCQSTDEVQVINVVVGDNFKFCPDNIINHSVNYNIFSAKVTDETNTG